MGNQTRIRVAAVVLAAGSGTRMGTDGNKVYLPLGGRHIVAWTLDAISQVPHLVKTVLVIRPEDREIVNEILAREAAGLAAEVIAGGASRHESEQNALDHLREAILGERIDVVLVHDAARPLAGAAMMRQAVSVAAAFGGAVPAIPATSLITVHSDGVISTTDQRLVRVQTPQAFRARPLLDAYDAASRAGFEGTDTSSSVEKFSDLDVRTFDGDERNIKVTYAHDLFLAERVLADLHYTVC